MERFVGAKPDVIVAVDKSREICFEIETGSNLAKGIEKLRKRFERLKKEYEKVYIVVTEKNLRSKYRNFSDTITRNEIDQTIEKLADVYNSNPRKRKK